MTIGIIGDYYLDLTAGVLYGPKTLQGWPRWGVKMESVSPVGSQEEEGPQGAPDAAGTPGIVIYSGSGAPS